MNFVLVGVGGTGLSGIANLLQDCGWTNIVGIDAQSSQITNFLEEKGINIIIGHGKYMIQKDDFVIYSDVETIKNGPEVQQSIKYSRNNLNAKSYHYPLSYNQFLGELSKRFRTIAITGSKGKSSSTGMMIYAMEQNCESFGIGILGAMLPDYDNSNCVINKNHKNDIFDIISFITTGKTNKKGQFNYDLVKKYWFVIEACEYKEHFLLLDIDYAIITNKYWDHTDYFKTEQQYLDVFNKLKDIVKIEIIESKKEGEIIRENKILFNFDYLFGEHQQTNASLISELLKKIIPKNIDYKNLWKEYKGVGRRMEYLGNNSKGAEIYTDYGHTPDSVAVGIQAIQNKFLDKKLIVIFQPHQAKRILDQRNNFIKVFQGQKNIKTYIYKLYTARETWKNFQNYSIITKNNLTGFYDLGVHFSQNCNGNYIDTTNEIIKKIQSYNQNHIIVLFTAGGLDFEVRNWLKTKFTSY